MVEPSGARRTSRVEIFIHAEMPDELAQAWLQHLRDFDTAHPGCQFKLLASAPGMSMAQMLEALKVNPELPFSELLRGDP